MKVAFQNKTDFLEELELEKEFVKDKILRAVIHYEPAKHAPNLFLVTVVMGVLVRGVLIELCQFCGDMLNIPDRRANGTEEKAQRIFQEVTKRAEEMKLNIRGGMYEA